MAANMSILIVDSDIGIVRSNEPWAWPGDSPLGVRPPWALAVQGPWALAMGPGPVQKS